MHSCRQGNHPPDVDLPEYDLRRVATARNPRAVVEGYRVEILLRLATILGVRMCPLCPRCNSFSNMRGCQDKFGNNRRPVGGCFGGMNAFGAATEFQGHGTPHLHAEGHIVCMYQFGTLAEVASRVKERLVSVAECKAYQSWMHKEDPLNDDMHKSFEDQVYEAWQSRFSSREHDGMSVSPQYMAEDTSKGQWSRRSPLSSEAAAAGGERFKEAY